MHEEGDLKKTQGAIARVIILMDLYFRALNLGLSRLVPIATDRDVHPPSR